jgi:DUF3052 family protein
VAGYSSTSLPKKLGIGSGCRMSVVNPPKNYRDLVSPLPDGAKLVSKFDDTVDMAHLFVTKKRDLARFLTSTLKTMRRDAVIWVSWPKKAAGVPTDVTEDTIREIALPMGLVDIKVCAVDETWSGLKLVIRKENR